MFLSDEKLSFIVWLNFQKEHDDIKLKNLSGFKVKDHFSKNIQ